MAKSNAEYCTLYRQRQAAKAQALGIEVLKLEVAAGTKRKAQALIERHGFGCLAELVQTLIANAYALGDGPNPMINIPRSGFVPTAEQLEAVGRYVPPPEDDEDDQ